MISRSQIDKAGSILTGSKIVSDEDFIKYEDIFDEYRKEHLPILTKITLDIQSLLTSDGKNFYIAQRLKRKPRIIAKLQRLSTRLSQLQDIGGLRIIVPQNKDVDNIYEFLKKRLKYDIRATDYRENGRENTGYRALHIIINTDKRCVELQIRSKFQHYWAEGVERTSVIYGYDLKSEEGDTDVFNYFKELSNIFYQIDKGNEPAPNKKLVLDKLREKAEAIIDSSDKKNILYGHTNQNIIKSLIDKEIKRRGKFNNWILIFDWNSGCFIDWHAVENDPDTAIKEYVSYEKLYPSASGYEVVLVGSSDVSMLQETHSHYFGIEAYENILENIDMSLVNIRKRIPIDTGARTILLAMVNRGYWNKNLSIKTLKNHYCKNLFGFEDSLRILRDKELVIMESDRGPVCLNISKKSEIESYL